MRKSSYLLLVLFLISGCDVFGGGSSEGDRVSYEVEVTQGWEEGDTLRVRYVTGYGPWKENERSRSRIIHGEIDTVLSYRFSTTESIDVSTAGERTAICSPSGEEIVLGTNICMEAKVLGSNSHKMRLAVGGSGRSEEYEIEVDESDDKLLPKICLPTQGEDETCPGI